MAEPNVKHVIVDAGALIRNADVRAIGENVYTVTDIVREIRDKPTRQRLQVLPYELHFREPSHEAVHFVSEFSKKTGDYKSLSPVDLRLIALVYQLECEHVGKDHIKQEPDRNVMYIDRREVGKATEIAGFYKEKMTKNQAEFGSSTQPIGDLDIGENEDDVQTVAGSTKPTEQSPSPRDVDDQCEEGMDGDAEVTEHSESDEVIDGDAEAADELSGNEEDPDDGWITPANIKKKKKPADLNSERVNSTVACLTTDYAMQNVLIQMGLNVVSVDGMLIQQTRIFKLYCTACMKETADTTKVFCPNCGNKALRKICVILNADGSVQYLKNRRQITKRGKKYSLPAPVGGKHANNPILVEDQREAKQFTSKAAKVRYNVFDPDYVAHSSPFAPIDVHSRSALLGIRNQKTSNFASRRNPNEPQSKGKSKRK